MDQTMPPKRAAGNAAAIDLALFGVMSLIWGATWAAIKIGVTAVPPIFFAGMRYALTSILLALFVRGLVDRSAGNLFGAPS
jgi:drug/metabolite transporter (DMT)-like permease